MGIAAQWRLAELMGVEEDPFSVVVISTGIKVNLRGDRDEIFNGLKQSLRRESALASTGITCELKDAGQDCLTCASYVADREEEPRAPLCRLGRDQRLLEDRHEEMSRELRGEMDELARLAAPSAEYAELLVAVGD